jgi:hypothetical protein
VKNIERREPMPENTISGVQKVAVDPTVHASVAAYGPEAASGTQKTAGTKSETAPQSEPKAPTGSGGFSDVRLKFQVDEKTNEVTCMVIDRSSHRVIRTIPPDELKNLREGDLVQLYT